MTQVKKNTLIIVHGWDGHPHQAWFPWLAGELEKKEFEVLVPQLPRPESPRIENWVPELAKIATGADKNTFFVGHSMGCQTIARYLEGLPEDTKVGGAVFVAGFFKRLTGLEDEPDVYVTEKHWLGTPINLAKVKTHLPKSLALFSDDDPYVPLDNQDDFREILGSKIIIEKHMGHFNEASGITKLPIVLEKVLEISK